MRDVSDRPLFEFLSLLLLGDVQQQRNEQPRQELHTYIEIKEYRQKYILCKNSDLINMVLYLGSIYKIYRIISSLDLLIYSSGVVA